MYTDEKFRDLHSSFVHLFRFWAFITKIGNKKHERILGRKFYG